MYGLDVSARELAGTYPELGIGRGYDTERKAYISPGDTEEVLAACDPTWRIIIALARYAGLRCPSEVLSLKWSDVNFETERMTVPSCKTEHLAGKAYRVVPIFAALKPYLDEAFELAEAGAEFVVPGTHREAANKSGGWMNCNLCTQFLKIIKRAGLQPWPRLFYNLFGHEAGMGVEGFEPPTSSL